MPVVEQRAGNCYIWVISVFLFLCIVAGGTFLALYLTDPGSASVHWYPIAGVILVGLPWFFWLLTCSYRLISRACGFRMVCWGANFDGPGGSVDGGGTLGRGVSIGGAGGSAGNGMQSEKGAAEAGGNSTDSGDGARRVHFGGAMAVAEQEGNDSAAVSSHSRESELPLKLSMES
ncbi:hypothetical protein Ancab_000474 [Ancistrocladus abbreviatus]